MTDPASQPALDLLGDRLEYAVGRSVAAGGVPPGRRRGRVVLLAAMVAFVALALGAVAVFPDRGQPADAKVRAAAQQTVDTSTGRFEATLAATASSVMPAFDVVVTGAYDIPQGRFQTTVDLSSLADGLAAQGLDLLGADASVTVVVDGTTIYLRSGLVSSLLGSETEWVRLDLAELTGGEGLLDGASGMAAATVDPSAFLEMLESIGGDVTEVGQESVRGIETTRYSGSIDLDVAYQQVPAEHRAEIEEALGALVPGGIDLPSLPVEVWIDGDGLVRRFETTVSLGDMAGDMALPGMEAVPGELSVRVEYFDPGAPVDIAVPAPEETAELGELLDGIGLGFLADIDLGELRQRFEDFDPGELDLDGLEGHLDGLGDELEGFMDDLGGDEGSTGGG